MGFLIILIYIILSFVMGTLFISLSLSLIEVSVVTSYLEEVFLPDSYLSSPRLLFFLIGVALILFCLKYIQTVLQRSRKNKSISFESADGGVSITLFAIEDMLKKMLEGRKEVSRIRLRVSLRRKRIEVMTRGVLTAEVNLIEFTKEMQNKIKAKINTLLGEDKEVRVNLEIRKVSLDAKEKITEEREPEIPFRHYE